MLYHLEYRYSRRMCAENSREKGRIPFIHERREKKEKTERAGGIDPYARKIIQTLPRAISFSVHPRCRTGRLNRFSSARRNRRGSVGRIKRNPPLFSLAPFFFALGRRAYCGCSTFNARPFRQEQEDVNNRRKAETPYIRASTLTIKAPFTVRIL